MKQALNTLLCGMLTLVASPAADTVFKERGGIVAIEAESTSSRLGDWKKKTDVEGFSGDCHLEFTGNRTEGGPPDSPLRYSFLITRSGNYQLTLRARKRLESGRQDISNDCYVALKGDFESGGEAPLDVLKDDTKLYGGDAGAWAWATQLDVSHKKFPAIYQLKSGETYTLTISGRSKNFNIDRFLLVHESENLRQVQNDNPRQSRTASQEDEAPKLPPQVRRTLHNLEGRAIDATLLSSDGKTVTAIVRGRRYDIELSTLGEDDRKFIKEWSAVPEDGE